MKEWWPVMNDRAKVIDFYGAAPNYIDHMEPIWKSLPPERRGDFIVNAKFSHELGNPYLYTQLKDINCIDRYEYIKKIRRIRYRPILVVGGLGTYPHKIGKVPRLVLLNHGAGGTWSDSNHPSYAGGQGRGGFELILEPGDIPAAKDKRVSGKYIKVAVVGCPKLDKWYPPPKKKRDNPPTVVIGFHHDAFVTQESRSAFDHYKNYLPELVRWARESGEINIIGTGHPRFWDTMSKYWDKLGIEAIYDWDEVMRRADLYIRDQHSTIYEFASLNRPVILLNAPWYRRNVNHGIRFWQYANVGIQCDEPGELISCIRKALEDSPEQKLLRKNAVKAVYKYRGDATERAVKEILNLL